MICGFFIISLFDRERSVPVEGLNCSIEIGSTVLAFQKVAWNIFLVTIPSILIDSFSTA